MYLPRVTLDVILSSDTPVLIQTSSRLIWAYIMHQLPPTPTIRITSLNQSPINLEGDYIIYWMVAQRRLSWNFGLQRAVERCLELGKPLLVFEPLRLGYPWASDRFHLLLGWSRNYVSSPVVLHLAASQQS